MVTENCSHNELHEDKHIQHVSKRKVRRRMTEEGTPKNNKTMDLLVACWGEVLSRVGSCFGGPSDQDAAPYS